MALCLADEYILSRFLLTLLAISSLQLGFELLTPKPPADSASVARHDGKQDDRRVSTAYGLEDLLRRLSRRALLLKILEGLSLVLSAGGALYRPLTKSHGYPFIDFYFWSYLVLLYVLRASPSTSLGKFRQAIQQHANILYIVRWSLALVVLQTQHKQCSGILAFQQADLTLMVTTTFLLVILLLSPHSLATLPPAYLDPTRESYSSLLGMVSFAWLDSLLIGRWYNDTMKVQEVPMLSSVDEAASNVQAFQQVSAEPSLLSRLFRHFRHLLAIQAIYAALYGVFTFVPTLLLRSILQFVEDGQAATGEQAWINILLLFIVSILTAVAESRAIWIGQKMGLRLRSILISEIYSKALRRRTAPSNTKFRTGKTQMKTRNEFTQTLRALFRIFLQVEEAEATSPPIERRPPQTDVGTIVNLLATDAFRIADAGANMHQVWASVPVQIIVAITLLYLTLGFSAFAGVALMAAMMPLNTRIAQKFGSIQMEIIAASDARIQSTTEIVRSIRIIKFFAWESLFERSIEETRAKELRALRARYILWSIAATIWYGMPLLITFTSFLVYAVIARKSLTPSLAFTSLSLFNLLKAPLDDLVGTFARVQDSLVSIKRVEDFLAEEETDKYEQLSQREPKDSCKIGFEHASFVWGDCTQYYTTEDISSNEASKIDYTFALKNLNLTFSIGKLNVITGATGSGKSSMLLALLGEMTLVEGAVRMPAAINHESLRAKSDTEFLNSVAYCAQEAWLTNDTVRNNILFGSPYNAERYKAVLYACSLGLDVQTLTHGDLTWVGERGVSLSGGQKQRIAIARAIYSNARHILMDDCLSAVDSHTALALFKNCIKGPLMEGRTCILVTHNIAFTAADAAFLLILTNGSVAAAGNPRDLTDLGFLPELKGSSAKQSGKQGHHGDCQALAVGPEQLSDGVQELIQQETTNESQVDPPASEEAQSDGKIPWRNVLKYFSVMGGWRFWPLLAFFFAAQQFGSIATNWWVQELSNAYVRKGQQATEGYLGSAPTNVTHLNPSGSTHGIEVGYYFGKYALIIGTFLLFGLLRLLLVSFGSVEASTKIHRSLIKSIMSARFQFFDETSFGQIINNFSRDLQVIDMDLAVLAVATLHFLVALAGLIILIAVITPAFLGPGVFISIGYYLIGVIYMTAARELKQLESTQRSPLLQHLSETLSGIITIRAYGTVGQYSAGNLSRIDRVNRPSFFLAAAERWLALRLGLMGALVSLFAGSFAISSVGKLSAGAVGLSLSYAIVFSEHVLWLVRYQTANLQNMTPLQRIQAYIDLPQEESASINKVSVPQQWPSSGLIEYDGVSATYAPGLDSVLRNVTFTVNPLERVGIVGRTGVGKSSLALTLLRALEIQSGSIRIDGVNTRHVDLHILRRRLAIVPQEPTLFKGTLRFSLDPTHEHTDKDVLDALDSVGLLDSSDASESSAALDQTVLQPSSRESSQSDSSGSENAATYTSKFADLSFALTESGSNISQGQRQLVCIARAVLKASRIVVLDEATASIDHKTDIKIQACVRRMKSTVITIAHRLRTVIDYDRIIVLDDGQIKECDHPWKLLQSKGGIFKSMCEAAVDREDLRALAKTAWEMRPLQKV